MTDSQDIPKNLTMSWTVNRDLTSCLFMISTSLHVNAYLCPDSSAHGVLSPAPFRTKGLHWPAATMLAISDSHSHVSPRMVPQQKSRQPKLQPFPRVKRQVHVEVPRTTSFPCLGEFLKGPFRSRAPVEFPWQHHSPASLSAQCLHNG